MKVITAAVLMVLRLVTSSPSSHTITECEKRAHNSFTVAQKQNLCSTIGVSSIGPAVCASVAKNTLHFKFEDILELCQDSMTASPAQCMNKLDASMRSKYGVPLCKGADSTLPAECFRELSSLKGNNDKIKPEVSIQFCSSLEDRAPLLCMHAVSLSGLPLPMNQALRLCNDSVGSGDTSSRSYYNNVAASCILDMKYLVNPSRGLTAQDVVRFCAESNPSVYVTSDDELHRPGASHSESAECYKRASEIKPTAEAASNTHMFSVKQRLQLCSNAPVALGPVNCSLSVMGRAREPTSRLKAAELSELCSGATGSGPGDCLLESKGLGTVEERIRLCNSADSAGPARCYRRAVNTFRNDPLSSSLLCVGAGGEDPAVCVAAAPHYLQTSEKIHLCASAPHQKGPHPVQCLQAVHSASRSYENAPKKALGYFIENLLLASERTSRELMISLCSFAESVDPLASAECYKSVPNSLNHDDAVRMCTNVSSTEIIQHMQLCHRILPRDWQSEEASTLCEGTESRAQVEAAVKCAVEAMRFQFPKLTRLDAARLCESERPSGAVLSCAKEVSRTPSSNPGAGYIITPKTLVDTCSRAVDISRGVCLSKLTTHSAQKFIFDAAVPARLCRLAEPLAVLACLEGMHKRMVTVDDVDLCVSEKRVLKVIRVTKMLTEDNDIEVTAGRRFLLWFDLFDQWGGRFVDATKEFVFSASINGNNPQGAILWGHRTNYSSDGSLQMNNLVVSQAGSVEFKISYRRVGDAPSDPSQPPSQSSEASRRDLVQLEMFHLAVKEDPKVVNAAPCLFVFKDAFCPADGPDSVWLSEFPRIRSYSPARRYLQNLDCVQSMGVWHVDAWLGPDGSLWSEYRLGVDAIWTGVGMPRVEMTHAERLDLPADIVTSLISAEGETRRSLSARKKATKEALKTLRRAYYRKSLQWHPDRWAAMPMYATAVQGVFELINEANGALQTALSQGVADSGPAMGTEGEENLYS